MDLKVTAEMFNTGKNYFLNQKEVSDAAKKYFPGSVQVLQKIDKMQGEPFNITVNAVGTGLVAPFFIAYNPMSKTDKDTKVYSAWRQPVSAVLAIVTQCGLVIPWNMWIDHLSHNGKLGDFFTCQGIRSEKYLKRLVRKENKGASKDRIKEIVKQKQAEDFGKLYAELSEKGTLTIGGKKLPDAEVIEIIESVAKDEVKSIDETIARYTSEQLDCRVKRGKFLFNKDNAALEKLQEVKAKISATSGDKEAKKCLKELIKDAKRGGAVEEWIKILQEDLLPKGEKQPIIEKIEKIIKHAKIIQYHETFVTAQQQIMKDFETKCANKEAEKDLYNNILKAIKEKKPVNELIKQLKGLPDNLSKIDPKVKSDTIGAVIKKYSDIISKRMTGFKCVTGLVISLAIMPFTCCLLNEIYPVFMDKFFPNLSKPKKEGGKLNVNK